MDEIRDWTLIAKARGLRHTHWCHLTADTEDELHAFAARLGLRRSWFQTRALHAYLRWRTQNARHPDVLAAQRRERARIRSERGLRWGGRPMPAAT
ncbi:DUF4031 domain-containing protein [Streptomyces sp. YPW6]|uniref:DUF4031 domain-containing protein n=1 Tax=Streptomyces sp. YPW6 TaxID=2840373 RepID=UPI001C0E8653|nr:DUF4031 domain-containing protein [Streptomyces sp. YPW6]QWQ39587.1 DUF4031 domain-containing protein [Streptomyces sp. YPW6]